MSHYETKTLETLERIANCLEDIAGALVLIGDRYVNGPGGNTPAGETSFTATTTVVPSSDAYDTAVAALRNMPDDIPAAPVKEEKPVTKPEIVAALNQHAKLHGIESSKKILASFGPKLDAIDPARYGDLLAQLGVKA